MKKFAALLRVSFRGMLLTANPTRKNRKKAATGAGFLVLMCCLMLYLGGVYSFVFASLLAPLGRLDLMLSLMALIGVSMSFFLGVASGAGFVFGGRDNDILLAMPVSAFAVLLSKVLALYLENLALMLFVLLPAGAAYLRYVGFAAAFLPLLLLGALLLAGVRDQTTVVACLIAASAPAVAATTMFSAKFNQDTILSVGVVSFSTLLSLATMPLVVGLARYLTAS